MWSWHIENGQAERTTPVRNGSRMTAGGLLGLRLGLLYSRKATARSARRGARPESDPRTHAIGTGPG